MSEPNKPSVWVELLKYPVTIFSLLLALLVAQSMLGVQFGQVTELGPGGIKFVQQASGEIANLDGKLNGVLAEIEALKKAAPTVTTAASTETQSVVFAASQTVSDQTAQFASVAREVAPSGPSARKGYIWIGDYKGDWGKTMLGTGSDDTPVRGKPEALPLGATYTALGNMVVRDGLPSNDAEYFRARSSLGVIPKGTPLRLLGTPVAIDREYAVQYWAQIEWK